jgi:hypothetical protein
MRGLGNPRLPPPHPLCSRLPHKPFFSTPPVAFYAGAGAPLSGVQMLVDGIRNPQ